MEAVGFLFLFLVRGKHSLPFKQLEMFALECIPGLDDFYNECPVAEAESSLPEAASEAAGDDGEEAASGGAEALPGVHPRTACSDIPARPQPRRLSLEAAASPSKKCYFWSLDCRHQLYLWSDDNPNRSNERKDKKMVIQKPVGTTEYTAGSSDTLNSIALKFNITPNKLVELNRLFTHTIVPGQVLFVPDTEPYSRAATCVSASGGVVSASSSDAEYDKLPDADLARMAKPIERVLSSTSEEEEPVVVKFLKMNCRYITDGKGVVGGVMIVTPNNVMFDPHKSDPLVIENGVEEYGLICPMDEVVSIALYSDISHMKIKDALPS